MESGTEEERKGTDRKGVTGEGEDANTQATTTFFKNAAAVSLFVAVIRFTPSGDWTRIICHK